MSNLPHHDPAQEASFDKFKDPIPATLPIHQLPARNAVGARATKLAKPLPHSILEEFEIDKDVMANVCFSPDPYHFPFLETLDLHCFDSSTLPTTGMNVLVRDD